jgi:hypothetical protein
MADYCDRGIEPSLSRGNGSSRNEPQGIENILCVLKRVTSECFDWKKARDIFAWIADSFGNDRIGANKNGPPSRDGSPFVTLSRRQ